MEAGWSTRPVARQLGRSDCVVMRCWDQWMRVMSFKRRPGSGRLRQTSRREDRHIVSPSLRVPVSSRNIRRRLAEEHLAGVTVWGVIAYNTRSPLVLIHGTITAQRYVHDIQQTHVLPLRQRLPGAIFQQNNARPHTARVSQDCLRTVTTLPLPSRSPDLSPIEHIWDHLGRLIGHPTNLNKLEARLEQIWNEMSEDIIQNLYASMPNRISSCIRAKGGSTGY
ncbi:transposable element Tcb1 transposase [Trichonephila clavipes]|uniref:Transposable element Tcb1 transposase n=1 Tax=Trichonephila clavipes TaxID=2585209 RepID=A0A8X6RVB7_TRICX|nr:transposable element Tcb1 transposase [Trichonephila clavipes]